MVVLNNLKGNEQGYVAMEMILALFVFALLVPAAVVLIFSNQFAVIDTENNHTSLILAKEVFEQTQAVGRSDFKSLSPLAEISEGDFLKDNYLEEVSDFAIFSDSRSWHKNYDLKKVELPTAFIDWKNALGKDSCALSFRGNWLSPVLTKSFDTSSGEFVLDVDIHNRKVFIVVDSSTPSKKDFFILDVSNQSTPTIINSLNTGPGLSAVHVADDYAFVANTSLSTGQFQVINLNNLIVKSYPISGGAGRSIFYNNKKIYIGLEKATGPEFQIFDVTYPEFPFWLGAFETNTVVSNIFVKDGLAYIATGEGNQFRILDVSNPANIFELGSLGWLSQSGQSLAVLGKQVVFGRAGGLPNSGQHEIFLLDTENKTLPTSVFSLDLNVSIRDIFWRDGLVFLATNKPGAEFQVFERLNNSLVFKSSLNLGSPATALDCEDESMFVLSENGKLSILNPSFN